MQKSKIILSFILPALIFFFFPCIAQSMEPIVKEHSQKKLWATVQMLQKQVKTLQDLNDTLQAQIDELLPLVPLAPFIVVDEGDISGMAGPNIIIEGANLHIRSGSGATNDGGALTGLGNLVVGYNEIGSFGTKRTGSHNIVTGDDNGFSSYGGIVSGFENNINERYANILGGQLNEANGFASSITGGIQNLTTGNYSSITGGQRNSATNQNASVTGGSDNVASGHTASVNGGIGNEANGLQSIISGGYRNTASGPEAVVSGGGDNIANGTGSTVSGGRELVADTDFSHLP